MSNNPFVDVLTVVCGCLDTVGIRYAVTGSLVSSIFGEPVTTQDVDICLRMTVDEAKKLDGVLPQRFYRSVEAMADSVMRHSMSNLIDTDTGLKIDLSVLAPEPFYNSVLARRRQIAFGPDVPSFWTVTAEDIILMKLVWRRDTQSQKQWDNSVSVARSRNATLDWRYLQDWSARLGLEKDIESLRVEAGV